MVATFSWTQNIIAWQTFPLKTLYQRLPKSWPHNHRQRGCNTIRMGLQQRWCEVAAGIFLRIWIREGHNRLDCETADAGLNLQVDARLRNYLQSASCCRTCLLISTESFIKQAFSRASFVNHCDTSIWKQERCLKVASAALVSSFEFSSPVWDWCLGMNRFSPDAESRERRSLHCVTSAPGPHCQSNFPSTTRDSPFMLCGDKAPANKLMNDWAQGPDATMCQLKACLPEIYVS